MTTLTDDVLMALDPVRFAARAGYDMDAWQQGVLRSSAKHVVMLASRQSGKSTVASVMAVHQALYTPSSLVLVVSPSLRQSGELFRKCAGVYKAFGGDVPPQSETRLSLELANGSRIVSLPGSERTTRGFSAPTLVIEDEASRVADELHDAIRPMLATSNGRLVLLSTPWGRRGHFYGVWQNGGPGWHRAMVTAHQVPRIDKGWLDDERRSIPDHVFRSEYLCEFTDTDDAVFRSEDIEAALDPTVRPLFT